MQRQQDIHEYNTRNKQKFNLKKHKKEKFKQRPDYIGIKFINFLADSIRREPSANKFKKKLKAFLVNNAFYSIEEYFKL